MNSSPSVVYIIDDDLSFRRSVEFLIRSVGYKVQPFRSAEDFLKSPHPDLPLCIILDVRMPGLSGLVLQRKLSESEHEIPIIFITGADYHESLSDLRRYKPLAENDEISPRQFDEIARINSSNASKVNALKDQIAAAAANVKLAEAADKGLILLILKHIPKYEFLMP